MSQITTHAELLFHTDKALNSLRLLESEVRATVQRLNSQRIAIPIGAGEHFDRGTRFAADDHMRRNGIQASQSRWASPGETLAGFRPAVSEFHLAVREFRTAVASMRGGGGGGSPTGTGGGGAAGAGAAAGAAATPGAVLSRAFAGGAVGAAVWGAYQAGQLLRQRWDADARNRDSLDEQAQAGLADARRGVEGRWLNPLYMIGKANAALGRDVDPDEILRISEQTVKDAATKERHAKTVDEGIQRNAQLRRQIIEQTKSAFEAEREALDRWLKDQEKFADEVRQAGNAREGRRLYDQASSYVSREKDRLARQEAAGEDARRVELRRIDRAGAVAGLRATGRESEARMLERRGAVGDTVESLRIAWREAEGGNDSAAARHAYWRYAHAVGAAHQEQAAIGFEESGRQWRAAVGSQMNVIASGARARFARMRGTGTAAGEHAARLAEEQYAAGERSRGLAAELSMERDEGNRARLGRELSAADAERDVTIYANQMREIRRIRESVHDVIIGKARAELAEHQKDWTKETEIFELEWQRRINNTATAREREAAIDQRNAERQAREVRRARDMGTLHAEGTEAMLRGAGQGGLADARALARQIQEQLREAGGDDEQRRLVARRGRGMFQANARGLVSSGIYGSWTDFLRQGQADVLSGRGAGLDFMQDQFRALGAVQGGTRGQGDRALDAAGRNLNAAADKLLKAPNVMILRDK